MAIIALVTAAGSPGATTTALGLGLTWAGPTLLIEADPAGSALSSGYFRGTIDHSRGLLNLVLGGGRDDLPAAIIAESRVLDAQADRRVLVGLSEAGQAAAMQPWWEQIARALVHLDAAGHTVIVDAGRLTQGSYPMPLLTVADQVLLVCRGTLSSAVRSQPIVAALADSLQRQGRADALGLVVIGQREYTAAEVARSLQAPLALRLPDDPRHAAVLSDGARERRFATSGLARSYRDGSRELAERIGRRESRLHGAGRPARTATVPPPPAPGTSAAAASGGEAGVRTLISDDRGSMLTSDDRGSMLTSDDRGSR